MKSLKGTRTEKVLLAAFAGESQARNRYTYFASEAKKEGYEQISAIFLETADNEKEHAKRFFKFLEGGDVEITATYPAGIIGNTAENLKEAAAGENLEWTTLYPESAKVADEEGFTEIATVFREISEVEAGHEKNVHVYWQRVKEMSGYVTAGAAARAAQSVDDKTVSELKTILNRIFKAESESVECDKASEAKGLLIEAFEMLGGDVESIG